MATEILSRAMNQMILNEIPCNAAAARPPQPPFRRRRRLHHPRTSPCISKVTTNRLFLQEGPIVGSINKNSTPTTIRRQRAFQLKDEIQIKMAARRQGKKNARFSKTNRSIVESHQAVPTTLLYNNNNNNNNNTVAPPLERPPLPPPAPSRRTMFGKRRHTIDTSQRNLCPEEPQAPPVLDHHATAATATATATIINDEETVVLNRPRPVPTIVVPAQPRRHTMSSKRTHKQEKEVCLKRMAQHDTWYYSSNHVLVNRERIMKGIPPLKRNTALDELARSVAQTFANRNMTSSTLYQRHQPDPMTMALTDAPADAVAGNIILGGSIRDIHQRMMQFGIVPLASKERSNILNPNFTDFGMGTAKNKDDKLYLCQFFGITAAAAASENQQQQL
jgi:uncharacterized protein YkwD